MTPIEIIALIFVIVAILKLIVLFVAVKPAKAMKIAKPLWTQHPAVVHIVGIALLAVLGYFLLQELSIVQLVAAMFFGFLLMAMFLMPYTKSVLKLAEEILKNKCKAWLAWLIILVMSLWVLKELFL